MMSIEMSSVGGFIDSDSIEVTVRPSCSSPRRAVTTLTVVAMPAMAARNSALPITGWRGGCSFIVSGKSKSAISSVTVTLTSLN
jgi:hypothetical protein